MNTITDNELILYFYRDGLDAQRIDEIDDALYASTELRARYTRLQHLLHEADTSTIEPDARLAERVWERVQARIDASEPIGLRWHVRLHAALSSLLAPRFAFAATCLLVMALGIGYYAGRWSAPGADELAQTRANAMAENVLDNYVAEHLRATQSLLLTAVNSDSSELRAGNRDLAASLIDSNRLYALAAARSGNTRLADFLRQLEPVLLEVANQPADASIQSIDGLREYLKKTDLLFQVRATQARIDAAGRHRT
jgi:hypothetical protein